MVRLMGSREGLAAAVPQGQRALAFTNLSGSIMTTLKC